LSFFLIFSAKEPSESNELDKECMKFIEVEDEMDEL
jgi:hypothetical protein